MLDTQNKVVVSQMAYDLKGNQILKIAYEVRELKANGVRVADLTIGDFYTPEFGIPKELRERIKLNYDEGYTNYPPAMGTLELRKAVAQMYKSELGVEYQPEEILIASGTRPLIFAAYMGIVDPSEMVVYGAPSWNNNHYCHIVGAFGQAVPTTPANQFMLQAEDIRPYVGKAVMVVLNTPQNPSGTVITEEMLRPICEMVLEENYTRVRRGAKPLYVVYDQVYWRMVYGRKHVHPVALYPEMKDFTIYVDGASKNLAATGLRVGWAALPPHLVTPLSHLVGHMGAWAPKPEQLAIASYLPMQEAQLRYLDTLCNEMRLRLDRLHGAIQELRQKGLPVDSILPQGGLFLSCCFDLTGLRTPEGQVLKTQEDIRKYLLSEGKCAFVPFAAFGDTANEGWFRASVSGLSKADFDFGIQQLTGALQRLDRGL